MNTNQFNQLRASSLKRSLFSAAAAVVFASSASASAGGDAPAINSGDTAWMLVASLLVLLMTLPGLALFYGGLVRAKNVLSILVQCFAMAGVMSLLWVIYGYSLATTDGNAFIGGVDQLMLKGLTVDSVSGSIPESVFVMFQMTFAIITPALIIGAFAERIKFSAVLIFSVIWFTISYLPIWHMAWNTTEEIGGLFHRWHVIDFAGGTVVHINAAVAGLVGCIMVGPRRGFGKKPLTPHHVPFVLIGASLLWVGWFGFNAGSQLAADGGAGMAMLVTQIAAASAVVVWLAVELIVQKRATAIGAATGAVAGLVAITPAAGSVGVMGALVIGALSSVCCYFFAIKVKYWLKYDDSLDVFGVHGIGAIVGAVLAGVFCFESLGGSGSSNGLAMGAQVWAQTKSILVTAGWSGIAALIAFSVAKFTVGLRIDERGEEEGLDQQSHGESAYSDI